MPTDKDKQDFFTATWKADLVSPPEKINWLFIE